MSKEYLETLEKIKQEFNCDPEYYGLGGAFEILESALHRLESIDNANPSEALEDLIDMIEYFTRLDYVEPIVRNEIHDKFKDIYWHKLPHLDSIKEALLKAQEQEKENELLKEIIKSLFDRGCPLHQYTDKEGVLTIEVDSECSIMRIGIYKGVDLDKTLKEVLE